MKNWSKIDVTVHKAELQRKLEEDGEEQSS